MSKTISILLAVFALVKADNFGHIYEDVPRPYNYGYAVHDDYSGSTFNAQESADGKNVIGSYQVHLPDGRIQTVKYTADHYNG